MRPTSDLAEVVERERVAIAIIATPGHAAQDVADQLVAAGVHSILNFSPVLLSVPEGFAVRSVDLAVELQILSFHQHQRDTAGVPPASARDRPSIMGNP